MKIAIATKSPDKITGIKNALFRFFNSATTIECYSISVESGVSNQPFDSETYEGALNRVNNIRNELPDMDYYISCEAGIENTFDQYFNVQVVCIFESKSQRIFWGKSSGWSLPTNDIEIIRNDTLDTYLRGKGISCIEELLGPSCSRSAAVAEATWLALASGKLRKD